MWHEIRHCRVYFYRDGMKASAINPACVPVAVVGHARSGRVRPCGGGGFHNKRVHTDPQRSGWMCPTAGCEKMTPACFSVRLWQIQHALWVWTCGQFKCRLVFYLDNEKKQSWGQVYLTVGPSGWSRCFQSAKGLVCIDLERGKKMCFCNLSALKCPRWSQWQVFSK